MKINEMLPVLRCPRSHSSLVLRNGRLLSEHGDEYPVVNGKPVLVKHVLPFHVNVPPSEKVSQNIPVFSVISFIDRRDAVVLHLGSGNVPSTDPRVISLDVLPCEHVDLVADAEELPFQNNTVDYVESGAVFEHIHNPLTTIKEVKRILKPGGIFYIDTAFMQSYHGYPGHYYNMTPLAAESGIVDDFVMMQSAVPDTATPLVSVTSLVDRFLSYLPEDDKARLLSMPLSDVLKVMKSDLSSKNPLLSQYSEYAMRSMAASFLVLAKKPEHYEDRVSAILRQGTAEFEKWNLLKQQYYESRMEVMLRHHEVSLYKRLAQEKNCGPQRIEDPAPVSQLMANCSVGDILDQDSISGAIKRLRSTAEDLKKTRDQWIALYLGPPSNAK